MFRYNNINLLYTKLKRFGIFLQLEYFGTSWAITQRSTMVAITWRRCFTFSIVSSKLVLHDTNNNLSKLSLFCSEQSSLSKQTTKTSACWRSTMSTWKLSTLTSLTKNWKIRRLKSSSVSWRASSKMFLKFFSDCSQWSARWWKQQNFLKLVIFNYINEFCLNW